MNEKELFDKITYIIRHKECDAIVALCEIDALIKEYRKTSVSRSFTMEELYRIATNYFTGDFEYVYDVVSDFFDHLIKLSTEEPKEKEPVSRRCYDCKHSHKHMGHRKKDLRNEFCIGCGHFHNWEARERGGR